MGRNILEGSVWMNGEGEPPTFTSDQGLRAQECQPPEVTRWQPISHEQRTEIQQEPNAASSLRTRSRFLDLRSAPGTMLFVPTACPGFSCHGHSEDRHRPRSWDLGAGPGHPPIPTPTPHRVALSSFKQVWGRESENSKTMLMSDGSGPHRC